MNITLKLNSHVEGKEADLSSDSAPVEKRTKRERKASEVEIKPATTIGCGCGGRAC